MTTTIVRYKVQADKAEENRAFIGKVFEELAESKPQGLKYASFNLEDGQTFVHVAIVDTADGINPLPEMNSFKAFVADLRDRCEEPPAPTPADIMGMYGF